MSLEATYLPRSLQLLIGKIVKKALHENFKCYGAKAEIRFRKIIDTVDINPIVKQVCEIREG